MTSQACGREGLAVDSILLLPRLLTEKAFIKQTPPPRAHQAITPYDVTCFGSWIMPQNGVYCAHGHKGVLFLSFCKAGCDLNLSPLKLRRGFPYTWIHWRCKVLSWVKRTQAVRWALLHSGEWLFSCNSTERSRTSINEVGCNQNFRIRSIDFG